MEFSGAAWNTCQFTVLRIVCKTPKTAVTMMCDRGCRAALDNDKQWYRLIMRADTPRSLLDRLRVDSSAQDWEIFCAIYRPLIERSLAHHSLFVSDVDDVTQDILARVFRALPTFEHNGRAGAFRKWIGQIVVQQLWQHARSRSRQPVLVQSNMENFADARLVSDLESYWQAEHDQHVLSRLLEIIRSEFTRRTWRAFVLVCLESQTISSAAQELNISPNAVMIAKSRVLSRLRSLGRELVDSI